MNERQFTEQVIDAAHRLGWKVAHFTQARGKEGAWFTPVKADGKGWLDLTLVRERVIFAELKVGYNKPTPEQRGWIEALEEAGQEVYVWTPKDVDDIDRVLKLVVPLNVSSAMTFVRSAG